MPKHKRMVQKVTGEAVQVITRGNVVASFVTEMNACFQELNARRHFAKDLADWMKTKPGMAEDFERFRAKNYPKA